MSLSLEMVHKNLHKGGEGAIEWVDLKQVEIKIRAVLELRRRFFIRDVCLGPIEIQSLIASCLAVKMGTQLAVRNRITGP